MTLGGWVFFSIAWLSLLALNIYCFGKVLKNPHKS